MQASEKTRVLLLVAYVATLLTVVFVVLTTVQRAQAAQLIITKFATDDSSPVRSGMVGGTGGQPFSSPCDSGEALAGLEGRAGSAKDPRIFQIRAVCGRMELAERPGPSGRRGIAIVDYTNKERFGESGGVEFRNVCKDGRMMKSVELQGVPFSDGKAYITSIGVECAAFEVDSAGAVSTTSLDVLNPVGSGVNGVGHVSFECPRERVLAGIEGRTGVWIDAFGVYCVALRVPPVLHPRLPLFGPR